MDQHNNTAAFNDSAGVLPMDTGAIVNGNHDEGENTPPSSNNATGKKGRGRPPKSVGSTKISKDVDTPKRGRGRPSKAGEIAPIKKVVEPKQKVEEVSTNGDTNTKKRGRPTKGNTPSEHMNGISKPHVQATPVAIPHEQDDTDESSKKKRGRPPGVLPKKAVVPVTSPVPKETSPAKKRGRPSGSAGAKKVAPKPKASTNTDGAVRKRGRPKKSTTTPTVATTSANETATVPSNNVQ